MNTKVLAKIGKTMVTFAGPLTEGITTVWTAIESQKQKQTIAELVKKVAELEAKIK